MKIGTSTVTDSRSPRMFSSTSSAMKPNSAASFHCRKSPGTKLNKASPAAAIDTVMVST